MTRVLRLLTRFRADTRGTALVELAMLIPLMLLMVLGIVDFGRLYWNESMAQKATAVAARIAAVRPPACAGVPSVIGAAAVPPGNIAPQFGTLCRTGTICAVTMPAPCTLDLANPTAAEIWTRIRPLMPPGSTPANVRIGYSFDERIGFLGGPFSPVVTAELVNLQFQFVSPLGALGALASGDPTVANASPSTISLPSMSMTIPGEDMASGIGS